MQAWTLVDSPVGELLLVTNGAALTGIRFEPGGQLTTGRATRDDEHPVLVATAGQLAAYFARGRREFNLPLAPMGTPFQCRVWSALQAIPYGTTTTYGEIARRIGLLPGASRAVGLANGSNPLPIVVPCHRVIGSTGALTGYGGGLDRKRLLLDLEADALF